MPASKMACFYSATPACIPTGVDTEKTNVRKSRIRTPAKPSVGSRMNATSEADGAENTGLHQKCGRSLD